ncbi:MAG: helix-turn-helix domain-containing protein [Candidatus Gastranaerophilales bacterium]|nr:helix-turn-helix domain-containing protein [Candidatus Gastranaerophilales bacterium]
MNIEKHFGNTICHYRQLHQMTQEEFASRLGVTPQAVSKWERGNGLPDLSLVPGICKILRVNANELLDIDNKLVENGNIAAEKEIRDNMTAEPLTLEFGRDIIACVMAGLETDYINTKRRELVTQTGMLMPLLRVQDNLKLDPNAFQIISYDRILFHGSLESFDDRAYQGMIDQVTLCCRERYADLINKHLVKSMIDNIKERFPGVADGLIPEKISYLQLERKLQEKLRHGETIRDLIHILEEMEESITD